MTTKKERSKNEVYALCWLALWNQILISRKHYLVIQELRLIRNNYILKNSKESVNFFRNSWNCVSWILSHEYVPNSIFREIGVWLYNVDRHAIHFLPAVSCELKTAAGENKDFCVRFSWIGLFTEGLLCDV